MEALSFLVVVLLIVILIIIISLKNSITSTMNVLNHKIDFLASELKKARLRDEQSSPQKKEEEKPVRISHPVPPVVPVPEVIKGKEPEKPVPEVKPVPVPEKPVVVEQPAAVTPPLTVSPLSPPPPQQQIPRPPVPRPAPMPQKPGFFERNPDLEKFVGENLANKIGIAILVLGIGFFVKYAIDQDWINEIGRVFIGIACGGILIGVAHRLRNTFKPFSSVLVGGGIAVLYLTIAIAFHEYGIFSQTAAFILMVVITGFAIVLSLGYDRMELAVLAILGGFASPFMVSTGEGNYVVLFTYVLILDVGMLVLAYYKKWNLVNIIAYVFTLILFGSWLASRFDGDNGGMIAGALVFATAFYLVFFLMNIINNIRQRTAFKAIEISMLLSNTFCYYAAGMVILDNELGHDYRGLFTAALGVFNFVFAYALYKKSSIDRNLVFLLIGLVLTFLSLAAPVQLEGNYITLFWAAETVLLLWLSQKSGIRLMKLGSVIIMVLMVFSLVMDWDQLYFTGTTVLPVILNKAYITGVFAVLAIAASLYFLRFETTEQQDYVDVYKIVLTLGGTVLLYMSQFLELQYQLSRFMDDLAGIKVIIGVYNTFFILMLLLAERKLRIPEGLRKAFAAWGAIAILSYLVFYNAQIIEARDNYLTGTASVTGFVFHYVYIVLLVLVSVITLKRVQRLTEFNTSTYNAYSWFYVFFFVFLLSAELDHVVLWLAYSGDNMHHVLTQNHKIGYPILWGLTSFVLIALGLKQKKKHLRIISLTLLLVTLLKLFLLDIRGISEGGKIAAFISLGVLLLVVSFMYQRLKKIFVDETSSQLPENEKPTE